MFEAYYSLIGDFIVQYQGYESGTICATNGEVSFQVKTADPMVIAYLKQEKENMEALTTLSSDGVVLTLTFHQLQGKIKLNRLSISLEADAQVYPILPWVSAMNDQIKQLKHQVSDLKSRIERQDSLLDEMVAAKQENQDELLKRVHTLVNSGIKVEEEDHPQAEKF